MEEPDERPLAGRTAIANAPVSYGAFEITVGIVPNVPEATDFLDAVADAGYEGVDLGPVGYLGVGDELAERLSSRGLSLAGGYFELPFSEGGAFEAAVPGLDELLDIFDAAPTGPYPPRPTLADAGSAERAAKPGQAALDRSVGLDDDGWQRLASNLEVAAARCRERGYEPTFHHHTATYVEAQWEIDRLLELTDVGICLDTGHLLLGRGDPVSAVRDWGSRINQVHVKDASQEILDAIVADAQPVMEIWKRRAFCGLGTGDVEVDEVLNALEEVGYGGWVVVEQDMIPEEGEPASVAVDEQIANRRFLAERGL